MQKIPRKQLFTNALKAAGMTVLAFIVSSLVIAPFSASTSSIFSSPEKSDNVLSDFFAQVADRRPVRTVSDKVLVVDIDRAGREEIATLLDVIAMCNPKAVALDVNFEEAHEDDSHLLFSLQNTPGLVLPLGLRQTERGDFTIEDRPFFFDSIPGFTYAAANMPGKYVKSTIREFPVHFDIQDTPGVYGFAATAVSKTDTAAFNKLLSRNKEYETIDYASLVIPILSIEDVYERPEYLENKVVMVGAADAASDSHATPVKSSMAGIEIHAHAVSTILNGAYYTTVPKAWDYATAAFVCFSLIFLTLTLTGKVKGMFLRILQVFLIYGIVRLGYELYVSHHIVADFSITMMMVAFGLFAVDIWNGSIGLWEIIRDSYLKYKRKYRKSQTEPTL